MLSHPNAKPYYERIGVKDSIARNNDRVEEMKGEAKKRIVNRAGVFFKAISRHDGFGIGIKPAALAEVRTRSVCKAVEVNTDRINDARH
jgi:hypothetical protein